MGLFPCVPLGNGRKFPPPLTILDRYLSHLVTGKTSEIRTCREFFLIRVCTEFHLSKILSEFSRKPCPKFYNFYPNKLVPQAKILKFYPGSAHTPQVTFGGPPRGHHQSFPLKQVLLPRGCAKLKKRPGVGFYYNDTPGWTTYLRNQAHIYIRKFDVSGGCTCLPFQYQMLRKRHKPSCGVLSPMIHIGDDTR